jgi:hypothetical protein
MLKRYEDVNFPQSFFYKNRVTIRDISGKKLDHFNMRYTDFANCMILITSINPWILQIF